MTSSPAAIVFSAEAWAAELAARRRWGVRQGWRMLPEREREREFGTREGGSGRYLFDPFW